MRRTASVAITLVVLMQLAMPAPARGATGPYTYPFFDPTITRTQGCHQGCAYDYGMNYQRVAATRQCTVVELDSGNGLGECDENTTRDPNYVVIRHSGNPDQWSFYLHLSTVSVGLGDQVSAGEKIGTSGESGYACGPHLHYALYASATRSAANSLTPDGRWTTDPGRVPWLASYVGEHSQAGYSVFGGTTWTTWVELRNEGGRVWDWQNDSYGRGRVYLSAVNDAGNGTRNSLFYVSGDWTTTWEATKADVDNIAPGATARFTFMLKAPATSGTYWERFNLRSNGVWWFPYSYIGSYYIPISVQHCC